MRFYEARVVRCDRDKFLSIIRDITERTRAENEVRGLRDALAHVGRVTTLGVMTGSLAHEINQPLAAISINAKAALNMAGNHTIDVSELQDAMREIIADAQRAGDVLYRLRKLLVRGITERTPLDVKTLVDEVLRLVKGEMVARRIVVDEDVEPGVPEVLGDRVQLQQVILNLLINAFEAVRQLDVDDRRVTLRVGVDGSQVVVSVVDSGDGLSDPQIHEIFEPFYTTKDGGMGLGLTICRMIVTAHGGTLTAARNPDRGMTFSFCLDAPARPRILDRRRARWKRRLSPDMPTATVFIVDDDPSMRGALARLVRSAGLPVESFASAEEFLAAVDVKARAFLVLDARLTGMSGLELLACMAERASTIPVAVITAVDDGQIEVDALRAGAMAFLRKPFDPQSLLDAIARGLDGSAAVDCPA